MTVAGDDGRLLRAVLLREKDNVATVLNDVSNGSRVYLSNGKNVVAKEEIPKFHKVAVREIPIGVDILKYGEIIGRSSCSISQGDLVHTHNLTSLRAQPDR